MANGGLGLGLLQPLAAPLQSPPAGGRGNLAPPTPPLPPPSLSLALFPSAPAAGLAAAAAAAAARRPSRWVQKTLSCALSSANRVSFWSNCWIREATSFDGLASQNEVLPLLLSERESASEGKQVLDRGEETNEQIEA